MQNRFADQLRAAMGQMTQEELEAASGIPQTTISRYLRGNAQPNVARLETLERVLPTLRDLRAKAVAA